MITYLRQFNLPLEMKIKELEEIKNIINQYNNDITFEVNGDINQIKCTYTGSIEYPDNFITN